MRHVAATTTDNARAIADSERRDRRCERADRFAGSTQWNVETDPPERRIPGWYELEWDRVKTGRQLYEPLPEPKIVIDAVATIDQNVDRVRQHLAEHNRSTAR